LAGYYGEDSVYGDNTIVFEFPVKAKNFNKGKHQTNIYEQMELGAKMQHYWSDNSVSQTVHFTEEEGKYLKDVLEMYEDRLKTVSFLPLSDHGYAQAPYESITEEQYNEMANKLKPLDLSKISRQDKLAQDGNKYCDGDKCMLEIPDQK
jgi:hypothetical protein